MSRIFSFSSCRSLLIGPKNCFSDFWIQHPRFYPTTNLCFRAHFAKRLSRSCTAVNDVRTRGCVFMWRSLVLSEAASPRSAGLTQYSVAQRQDPAFFRSSVMASNSLPQSKKMRVYQYQLLNKIQPACNQIPRAPCASIPIINCSPRTTTLFNYVRIIIVITKLLPLFSMFVTTLCNSISLAQALRY